ncbi:WAP four-disulfide core domain protein 3-like isoform X3 [Sinocyclocheilus grahami]|uniref:WAP four-disulfide core domain protein 3-like isoform X3 n=1 Tax=Sinocyclocheilus grahami TaxID=75366 RepID=UPI0007AD6221|nr:PREDICTED: WAP four-disulfide core domain protein 3-like isoform X3 [Sinocyclocheilus grahami]
MTARVCCSLIAALFCVSVCLSTRAEGAATVNGSIHLAAGLLPAEPTKPGVCPRNDLEVAVSVCVEMCSHDGDCPKDEKCCSNGCGHQCMPPYKEPEKPGVCPKNPEVALLGGCVERCSHDRDCPKDEKCCSKGCGQQCMPPYREPEKPGVCPKNPEVALLGGCVERCSHDRDFPKLKTAE